MNINTGRNTKETTSKNRLKLLKKLHNKKNIQKGGYFSDFANTFSDNDTQKLIDLIDNQGNVQIAPHTEEGHDVVARMISKFYAKITDKELGIFLTRNSKYSDICPAYIGQTETKLQCKKKLRGNAWKQALYNFKDAQIDSEASGTVYFSSFVDKQNKYYSQYIAANAQKAEAAAALTKAQAEATQANSNLNSLKSEVKTLTQEKNKAEIDRDEFKKQLDITNKQLRSTEDLLNNTEYQLLETIEEKDSLTNKVATLESDKTQLQSEVAVLKDKIDENNKQIQSLNEDLEAKRNRISELEAIKQKNEEDIDRLNKELGDAMNQIKLLRVEYDKITTTLEETTLYIKNDLTEKINTIDSTVAGIEQKVNNYKEQEETLKQNLSTLVNALIASSKEKTQSFKEKLTEIIDILARRNDTYKTKTEKSQSDLEGKITQIVIDISTELSNKIETEKLEKKLRILVDSMLTTQFKEPYRLKYESKITEIGAKKENEKLTDKQNGEDGEVSGEERRGGMDDADDDDDEPDASLLEYLRDLDDLGNVQLDQSRAYIQKISQTQVHANNAALAGAKKTLLDAINTLSSTIGKEIGLIDGLTQQITGFFAHIEGLEEKVSVEHVSVDAELKEATENNEAAALDPNKDLAVKFNKLADTEDSLKQQIIDTIIALKGEYLTNLENIRSTITELKSKIDTQQQKIKDADTHNIEKEDLCSKEVDLCIETKNTEKQEATDKLREKQEQLKYEEDTHTNTRQTLADTGIELGNTKDALATTQKNLEDTGIELGNTKWALATTQQTLAKTQTNLEAEKKEKEEVNATLVKTKLAAEAAATAAAAEISAITEQKNAVEKQKDKCGEDLKIQQDEAAAAATKAKGENLALTEQLTEFKQKLRQSLGGHDKVERIFERIIFRINAENKIPPDDKEKENDNIKGKLREEEEKIQEMLQLILPIYNYNKELPEVQDSAFFDRLLQKDFTNGEGKTNWDDPDPPSDIQTAIENFELNIGKIAEEKDKIIEDINKLRSDSSIAKINQEKEDAETATSAAATAAAAKEEKLKQEQKNEKERLEQEAATAEAAAKEEADRLRTEAAEAETKAKEEARTKKEEVAAAKEEAERKAKEILDDAQKRAEDALNEANSINQGSATEIATLKADLKKTDNDNKSKDLEIEQLKKQLSTLKNNRLLPVVNTHLDTVRTHFKKKGGSAKEEDKDENEGDNAKEEALVLEQGSGLNTQTEPETQEGVKNVSSLGTVAKTVNIANRLGMTLEEEKAVLDLEKLQLELQQLLQKIEEEKMANSSNDDTNSQKLIESNDKIKELEREVERLRESISSLEESKEQLTDEENDLKQQLLEAKSKLQSDEANETEKRQQELERGIQHKKELQKKKDEAQEQAELAEADKAKAETELAEADKAKAEAELAEEEARIARETEEAHKKLEEKRLNDEANKELHEQITDCMEEKAQADIENLNNKGEIDRLTGELTSLKEQNRELETKKNEAEEISRRHMNTIEEIEGKLQIELENITRITKEKDELQQTITQDKKQYTQELKEQEDKFNANLLEIGEIKKENAKLEGALELEKKQREQLQADLDIRTKQYDDEKNKFIAATKRIRDLVSNVDDESQTVNVNLKYKEIKQEIDNLLNQGKITKEEYEGKFKPILKKYFDEINNIAESVLAENKDNLNSNFGGSHVSTSLTDVLSDPVKLASSDSKFTPQVLEKFGDYQEEIAELRRELLEKKQKDIAEQIKEEHKQELKDKKKEEDEKKNTELQKYYKDGKWDFDSLVDNHDLMEYIRFEKQDIFEQYNKYRKSKEDAALAVVDEAKRAKERVELEKMNAVNQKVEERESQLQEKINRLDDDKKKLAAENKELTKAFKEFKKEIKDLQELLRKAEEEIEIIKLEKGKSETELELCSGIKPSEDDDGIIAQFLNLFKNDVYKVEKKFLDIVNNIPQITAENVSERTKYLQQLIQELSKIKYSIEYSIKDLNLSNTKLSEILTHNINSSIDKGIEEYIEEIDR